MKQWQDTSDEVVKELPFHIAEWLLEFGSLTEKLERSINAKVRLEVLKENHCVASVEDAQMLGVAENTQLWSREVLLYGPEEPWIYAKTLVPASSAFLIESLGEKPLGSILFSEKQLSRQFLKVKQLASDHALFLSAQPYIKEETEKLWARRSLWQNSEQSDMELLVSEVFLPDAPLYNK
ncbi:MAG: chorismate lyase [Gammaproteobacteria bacterium]|nr:chorismate lyase [Gammaproteobacteria bacterium]